MTDSLSSITNINKNVPLKYPQPSDLVISTCTVISSIQDDLDLDLFSRTVDVYDVNSDQTKSEEGGIFNITLFSDYGRGSLFNEKKSKLKEFNNQVTINYKYWDFKVVNIKIFSNGKLQMTGIKYPKEVSMISKMIINQIKKMEVKIYMHLNVAKDEVNKSNKFNSSIFWVYNYNNNDINYYRCNNYYIQELLNFTGLKYDKNYLFSNSELKKLINIGTKKVISLKTKTRLLMVIIEDIDNCFNGRSRNQICVDDDIKFNTSSIDELTSDIDLNDGLLVEKLLIIISNQKDTDVIKHSSNVLNILISHINLLYVLLNFKFNKNLNCSDQNDFNKFVENFDEELTKFETNMNKRFDKMNKICEKDTGICNVMNIRICPKIKAQLTSKFKSGTLNVYNIMKDIPIVKFPYLEVSNLKGNYDVGYIKIALINSDFQTMFAIDLSKISKTLLNTYKISNSYDKDDYSGVLAKYYYHDNNKVQGICSCQVHCSLKDKKSTCCKITIIIFRPGSVIITGAKNIKQLEHTYKFINKVFETHFKEIRGINNEDGIISSDVNNMRRMSRKPKLFFIKKTDIKCN
jgi:TATA-box binding protein (TBP) (component of TFIID and TFIIIB)